MTPGRLPSVPRARPSRRTRCSARPRGGAARRPWAAVARTGASRGGPRPCAGERESAWTCVRCCWPPASATARARPRHLVGGARPRAGGGTDRGPRAPLRAGLEAARDMSPADTPRWTTGRVGGRRGASAVDRDRARRVPRRRLARVGPAPPLRGPALRRDRRRHAGHGRRAHGRPGRRGLGAALQLGGPRGAGVPLVQASRAFKAPTVDQLATRARSPTSPAARSRSPTRCSAPQRAATLEGGLSQRGSPRALGAGRLPDRVEDEIDFDPATSATGTSAQPPPRLEAAASLLPPGRVRPRPYAWTSAAPPAAPPG